MMLTRFACLFYFVTNRLNCPRHFGNNYTGSTAGNSRINGDKSGVPSHNFHHRAAIVGLRGITKFVNKFHGGVHSGVITNCIFAHGNVIVYGTWNAYAWNSSGGKIGGTPKRAVSSDNHYSFYTLFNTGFFSLLESFFKAELLAAGSIKHGTAVLNNIRYASYVQRLNIAVYQSVITSVYSHYLHILGDCCTNYRSYRRIHSRGVAAAGQYANFFHN